MKHFTELVLQPEFLRVLPELGIHNPTPIQSKALPILLKEENDFIGLAQTGTGKTAAFGLPLLQSINLFDQKPQALVLAPTRELGQQIAQQMVAFSKYVPEIKVLAVYGGASITNQIKELRKNPQIIIATPGRLIDLINRKVIKLNKITHVVLDEADEMLNMGFKEDIDNILSYTPGNKRTWLFSATMPKDIRAIVNKYMNNAIEVSVNAGNEVNVNIHHQYALIKSSDKMEALKRFMDVHRNMRGIVFCRTKLTAQSLSEDLAKQSYKVEALHGDLSQSQRDKVMDRFKSNAVMLLIATDVAARGLDITDLTHVIHYSLPDDQSYYTHRSGRTARAGKKGISLALINRKEIDRIYMLEKRLGIRFERAMIPSVQEIQTQRILQWAVNVVETTPSPKADGTIIREAHRIFASLSKNELVEKLVATEIDQLNYIGKGYDLNVPDEYKPKKRKASSNAIKFFINLGTIDKLSKIDLLDFICEQTRLKRQDINNIQLLKKHAYFEVDKAFAKKVTGSFKGLFIKGRKIRVNRDNG